MSIYSLKNKPQAEQTANPGKYPQGFFKDKSCKDCGAVFSPKAPSHKYCSQGCADKGMASAYLMRTYGITYRDYLRMLDEQDHKCSICGGEGFVMDASKHTLKLVVDHCHSSGKVRGLLCHNCNRALGLFHDSTATLTRAIEYLKV